MKEEVAQSADSFRSTRDLKLPHLLIDQVIGQDKAVALVRLAAKQGRFLLLVGEPGTGKSLMGRAIAELLPPPPARYLSAWANPDDRACPKIVSSSPEEFAASSSRLERELRMDQVSANFLGGLAAGAAAFLGLWLAIKEQSLAYFLVAALSVVIYGLLRRTRSKTAERGKILLTPCDSAAPFIDATALTEGALFGDVRHDPYQSGGQETPPHQLLELGAIHRAHGGVLYIDEIASLSSEAQRILLTVIQDKAWPITGRQSGSSGTSIRTPPIPCDFILVAACNPEDLDKVSPALRSRFLGYGYEVLTETSMRDTPENQAALARFVAREVEKDGRIPHFSPAAVDEIIAAARQRTHMRAHLTLRLRELGGLVRAAGDAAHGAPLVERHHVRLAFELARSIEEQQLAALPHSR